MNILSVDIGTSSVRACLVSPDLQIQHQTSRGIQLKTNATGKAELDVENVLKKTLTCIQETLDWAFAGPHPVDAISFSSASASLVCLDLDFNPVRPALTYADLRASKEAEWLIDTFGSNAFTQTAVPVHASYWLPKILWLKNQGLRFSQNLHFCTLKDLLIYRLTGQFMIDASNAAAAGMMNAKKMAWDELSLEVAGIQASQLPKIQPTTTLLELTTKDQALSISDKRTPKIVLGAMDGILASLGVGAYRQGQVTTSLGSSGACRMAANAPLIEQGDPRLWSYPLTQNIWIQGGAMNNGGLVTRWLTENFSRSRKTSEEAYCEMLEAASKITPGADGLLFLPYLFGERAPIYNEKARGVYFGLHNGHQREHFARAGLEGILYALYSIFEILQASQGKVQEIRATGGYVQSELMLQLQADIFGQPIHVPTEQEGSVIGAAALALLAMGKISNFDALEKFFKIKERYIPNKASHGIYQQNYTRFKTLYDLLKPIF
jgi:gluconokinase